MRKLTFITLLIFSLITGSAASIDKMRVGQIQKALRSAGYQQVSVNGVMDTNTVNALKDYQKRNKWQNKVVPDSRALICLGLGPHYKNLLNPETAVKMSCVVR